MVRTAKHVLAKDYTGQVLTLVNEKTHKPLVVGQKVKDFRGEVLTVVGGQAPHHSASTGRVHVESAKGWATEYFPGVVGAKWMKL
jgi:hypothetical protein